MDEQCNKYKKKYLNFKTVLLLGACVWLGFWSGVRHGWRTAKAHWRLRRVKDPNLSINEIRYKGGM